jgi:YVTN family beta-propeller protein
MRRYFWLLWILLPTPLAAATSRIFVMNNAGTTISVIDPATNKVVQTISGFEVPEAAHFSPTEAGPTSPLGLRTSSTCGI